MVVAAVDERTQRIFACVASRSVTAIVAEGDGLGEGNVETEGT